MPVMKLILNDSKGELEEKRKVFFPIIQTKEHGNIRNKDTEEERDTEKWERKRVLNPQKKQQRTELHWRRQWQDIAEKIKRRMDIRLKEIIM